MRRILALTLFCSLATAHADLTNGLVAYYQFNGNANDSSGSGNNGIAQNVTFTTDRFGNQSAAALFPGQIGTNSAIDCPTLDNLPYLPITYSTWFRLDGNTVADGEVMTLLGREQVGEFFEGAITFGTFSGYTNELMYIANQLFHFNYFHPATNRWYHSVLTIDTNALMRLFINGNLYGSSQSSPSELAGAMPLPFRIGASTLGDGVNPTGAPRYSWLGAIDDVRIYNRALSSSEVLSLYALESGMSLVTFVKAFTTDYQNLVPGSNYVLQASADLNTWTNFGGTFTATSVSYTNTSYQRIDDWGKLFFRLVSSP